MAPPSRSFLLPSFKMTTKITSERSQKMVQELALQPGNGKRSRVRRTASLNAIFEDICADCKAKNPRWASHNLGIYLWYVFDFLRFFLGSRRAFQCTLCQCSPKDRHAHYQSVRLMFSRNRHRFSFSFRKSITMDLWTKEQAEVRTSERLILNVTHTRPRT